MSRKVLFGMMVMLVLASLVLISGNVTAQTPVVSNSTWPYSATLTDTSGQPVADGTYDFIFSLYAAEKDTQVLWTETQTGVKVTNGEISTSLGASVAIPVSLSAKATYWLEVSVRGPGETAFTLLSPRRSYSSTTSNESKATLACPHSHFTDYWSGTANNTGVGYGLLLENYGTGDGIRAFSAATMTNYAAVYGVNTAATGYGTGLYGASQKGVGVYANSGTGDGLEATTSSTSSSAIYGHAVNANGVWAVSTNKIGVRGYSNASVGVQGVSTNGYGVQGYNDNASSVGNYGGYFTSNNYRGGFIGTGQTSLWYGLMVDGGLTVTNGSCVGCKLAYVGINNGSEALRPGDLIAAAGVKVDAAGGDPTILVRLATASTDPVIGVVVSGASEPGSKTGPDKIQTSEIKSGEYVLIGTTGLYQVRAAGTAIAIGDYLTPGPSGAIVSADKGSSIGLAMSEPDQDGLVWVMFNGN